MHTDSTHSAQRVDTASCYQQSSSALSLCVATATRHAPWVHHVARWCGQHGRGNKPALLYNAACAPAHQWAQGLGHTQTCAYTRAHMNSISLDSMPCMHTHMTANTRLSGEASKNKRTAFGPTWLKECNVPLRPLSALTGQHADTSCAYTQFKLLLPKHRRRCGASNLRVHGACIKHTVHCMYTQSQHTIPACVQQQKHMCVCIAPPAAYTACPLGKASDKPCPCCMLGAQCALSTSNRSSTHQPTGIIMMV